jgi:preprotein translocase subunit SecE
VSKVLDFIRSIREYFVHVGNELRKSSWPTRGELLESTIVVILSVVVFAVFVGLCDTVLARLIRLLVR